jgi:hypothetical protein
MLKKSVVSVRPRRPLLRCVWVCVLYTHTLTSIEVCVCVLYTHTLTSIEVFVCVCYTHIH